MGSSPPPVGAQPPAVAGMKRSASLLPPFEPSSSPQLPRPTKKLARESCEGGVSTYPTPVPTSSTAILSSSPARNQASKSRPPLTQSAAISERSPLSAVPCLMLQETGEPVTMGRSSASCTYQLSSSRLISRVHVQATFKPASNPFDRDRIEVLCTGWNGIKLHCQGKTYELGKGKTFTSDMKDADVMIDVQDARVLVQWPRPDRKDSASTNSDHTWEESSPVRDAQTAGVRGRSVQASPHRNRQRLASPISPSPAVQALAPPPVPTTPGRAGVSSGVVVYEDEPSPVKGGRASTNAVSVSQTTELASNPLDETLRNSTAGSSFGNKTEDLSEHDEENDPIVFSFGPYGDNILPRMASFNAGDSPSLSPKKSAKQAPTPTKRKRSLDDSKLEAVRNHIVNQLAFSRLASTPLSTIISHLPSELVKIGTTEERIPAHEVRDIINNSKCIGEVAREGKDAAGKALESEFYYVPDFDDDENRKEAVVNGLRKPGLRNCRKQHKQYFWRRPRTP